MARGTKYTERAFIALIAPIAVKLRQEGSPLLPSVRIAQTRLETGCVVSPWNNIVGYKATPTASRTPFWDGSSVNATTWEVYDGKRVDGIIAGWRAYPTIEQCLRDQDLLFARLRYQRVREAQTPEQQAVMLRACGYATDPQYADKLVRIIRQHDLKRFDKEAEQPMLSPNDANKIITFLSAAWQKAQSTPEKNELHRLANELRKASGQSLQ